MQQLTHTSNSHSEKLASTETEGKKILRQLDQSSDSRNHFAGAKSETGQESPTGSAAQRPPMNSRRESTLAEGLPSPSRSLTRSLKQIPLDQIDVDPDQIRRCNDLQTQEFTEMCANVAEYGILQAILVRPAPTAGRYILIAGEFRLEAARKAGHISIPCSIEEAPLDQTALVLRQLSENLQRQGLPHMDLALAFDWLTRPIEQGGGGLSGKDLAHRIGKSEAFVSEHKGLLSLSPEEQQVLAAGTLSFDQARAKLRKTSTRAKTSKASSASRNRVHSSALAEALPEYLDKGQYVYRDYSGYYPETELIVVVAGAAEAAPSLQNAIRAVEHHLHFLKLTQARRQ